MQHCIVPLRHLIVGNQLVLQVADSLGVIEIRGVELHQVLLLTRLCGFISLEALLGPGEIGLRGPIRLVVGPNVLTSVINNLLELVDRLTRELWCVVNTWLLVKVYSLNSELSGSLLHVRFVRNQ